MYRKVLSAGAAVGLVSALFISTAHAGGVGHQSVVTDNPVNWTPHVLDGQVYGMAVVGDKVVVGGRFTTVQNAGSQNQLTRRNIFAFDRDTGKVVGSFEPKIDGTVYDVAPAKNRTVVVGGTFTTVNGKTRRALTRLRVSDGGRVGGFRPRIPWGQVRDVVTKQGMIYAGGTFGKVGGLTRKALARLRLSDGAVDKSFNMRLADSRAGALRVQSLAVNPKGTKLVIGGTFQTVAGASRPQIAMINTGAPKLTNWATQAYAPACNPRFYTYMREIDFSPGGGYFVVVTTGGPGDPPTTLCDSAARWGTGARGSNLKPKWVNYTGGDSLYSVNVTGAAVYVGGHQRWLDNPEGRDSAGPGAVERPGIGAINPITGKALSWNPTRTRGHGVEALIASKEALWVGSDTDRLGHEYHARVGAFPLPN